MVERQRLLSTTLGLATAIGLIAIAWLTVTRQLPGPHHPLRAVPFGIDPSQRLDRGLEFSAAPEMDALSESDRRQFLIAAREQDSGYDAIAFRKLLAFKQSHPDFMPVRWRLALSGLRALGAGEGLGFPLGLNPKDSVTRLASVQVWKPQAIAAADSLIGGLLASGHPLALYLVGAWRFALRDTSGAATLWRKSLEASPDFAFPQIALARLALEQGDLPQARHYLQMAVTLWESDRDLYAGKGRWQGTLPRASMSPYGPLAQLYLLRRQPDTAELALDIAADHGLEDAGSSFARALWWESKGKTDFSRNIYVSLLRVQPAWKQVKDALSSMGLKPGKDDDALFTLQVLDPLLRRYPDNAPLQFAMSQAYFKRGLYGLAATTLDSALQLDPHLPGAADLQRIATARFAAQAKMSGSSGVTQNPNPNDANDGREKVILPGAIALLGTYSVGWGVSPLTVRRTYPNKIFVETPAGNMVERFVHEGLLHEYLLAFKDGHFYGVFALVTDTANGHIDVFGRMISYKTKISGEGRGTGDVTCSGYHPFQGVLFENDDTFEFMAQFQGKENQVRLARLSRDALPFDRRLCELVRYLDRDTWENKAPIVKLH